MILILNVAQIFDKILLVLSMCIKISVSLLILPNLVNIACFYNFLGNNRFFAYSLCIYCQ